MIDYLSAPTLDYPASFSEYNTDYTYDEGFNDFIDNFIENMIDQVIAQKRIKPIQNGETAQGSRTVWVVL